MPRILLAVVLFCASGAEPLQQPNLEFESRGTSSFSGRPTAPAKSQSADRLQSAALRYLGAFRVPNSFLASYSGHAAGVDLDTGEIYYLGHAHKQQVCRIKPPAEFGMSENTDELPVATLTLQWFDPVGDELRATLRDGGVRVGGLLPHDKRLLWTVWERYDADVNMTVSHGWWDGEPHGISRLDAPQAGYVGGYLARVPERWRETFGDVICGRSEGSIVGRRSTGPVAFGFNSAALGEVDPVPTVPLVYYPPVQGKQYRESVYAKASTVGAAFLDNGLVLLGTDSTGEVWYGGGTSDSGKVDPCSSNRGTHSEGKHAVARFYDPNELARVAAGEIRPWGVRPYAERKLDDHPTLRSPCAQVVSAAFDNRRSVLYCFQYNVVKAGHNRLPLVHVYKIR